MMSKLETLMSRLPQDVDAVILNSEHNRLYYTGLASSAGTLLVLREKAYFIIDFRYIEVAKKKAQGCEVLLQQKLGEQLRQLTGKHGVKRIALESENCSVKEYTSFCRMLPECEILTDDRVNAVITEQRMIKDEHELSLIRQAQELTDRSFEYILDYISPGKTEREIALELEFYSRKIGSEGPSFEFIVVSGPNSSLPHGVPGERVVQNGDFITMDYGCLIEGYHSDMTRTIAVGAPSDDMKAVYDKVLEANLKAIDAIKAGEPCNKIDAVARDLIAAAGYGGCFGHGLGHSLGVQIHEDPRFNPTDETVCVPGMMMTVEPGIYLEGRFGCRIEDTVYITENGCIDITKSPKELIVL